jgi:hypothetical protein
MNNDAGCGNSVMDNQAVQRITIRANSRGNKAPILGIDRAGRQSAAEFKDIRPVGEFGRRTLGRLHDHPNQVLREGR